MKEELEKQLYEKYPILLQNSKLRGPKLFQGFEFGDGWFDLINELCEKIEDYNNDIQEDSYVIAEQVKEKFGGLRFYVNRPKDVDDWVDEAEDKSFKTCEYCGKPGEIDNSKAWSKTLCEACG